MLQKVTAALVFSTVLALGLGALQSAPNGPSGETAAGGLRIAVVNLSECLDETRSEGAKDVRQELQKLREKVAQDQEDLYKKYQTVLEQLKSGPGPVLKEELLLKKERLIFEIKLAEDSSQKKYDNRARELFATLYNDIVRVVDIVSQDRFDLVFRVEDPQLDESSRTVASQINRRIVLFHNKSPKIDITTEVIRRYNEEYLQKKANPASAGRKYKCDKCGESFEANRCTKCNRDLPEPK